MNILQLYPKSDFFTGAAIQLRDLALGLAGRGHHVVVATRPNEHWGRACAAANVEHAAVSMRSGIDLPSARGPWPSSPASPCVSRSWSSIEG